MLPLVRLALVLTATVAGAASLGYYAAPRSQRVFTSEPASLSLPRAIVQVAAADEEFLPEAGWWWNPAEPGRGFILERSGDRLLVGALAYEADGRASWSLAVGRTQCEREFGGTLVAYSGGQTLTGRHRKAVAAGNIGPIELRFSSPARAIMVLPGGRTIALERYRLGGTAPSSFQPEAGWWWNPAEPGRGFGIEVRGGAMLLTGAMYDEAGRPVWYVSHGPLTAGRTYQGRWLRLVGGTTLAGGYRPTEDAVDAGAVAVRFTDATSAVLTLPDGRALPIGRADLASPRGVGAVAEVQPAKACSGGAIRLAQAPPS